LFFEGKSTGRFLRASVPSRRMPRLTGGRLDRFLKNCAADDLPQKNTKIAKTLVPFVFLVFYCG